MRKNTPEETEVARIRKNELNKALYKSKQEIVKAQHKAYYESNKDAAAKRYARNKEAVSQQRKQRRVTDGEAIEAIRRSKRQADPEAYRAKQRARYQTEHGRLQMISASARRRAQIRANFWLHFTPKELEDRLSIFSGCWMCNGPKEAIDHVKPISKGGPHILANLRPACQTCNSKKRGKWPIELRKVPV